MSVKSHLIIVLISISLVVEAVHFLLQLLAFVFFFCELPIHIICPIFIVLCVFFIDLYKILMYTGY